MLYPIVTLGSLGLLFGIGLYVASRVFHVYVDPRVERVSEALPGANCGGCGLPGCGALATAIVHGSSDVDACPVCSAPQLSEIARIMGVEIATGTRKVAVVHCQGRRVEDRFTYAGPATCGAATLLIGGQKACPFGCLGFGDCVAACPFGAIHLVDGIPVVTEQKCTACGKCVEACPPKAFTGRPYDPAEHRNLRFKIQRCIDYRLHLQNKVTGVKTCGMCVHVCPFGKTEK